MIAWTPSTPYTLRKRVIANVSTGFLYVCTVAGSTGTVEPLWPTKQGLTVADGSVTWQCGGFEPYFDQGALEDRLSRAVVTRLLDDNRDGFADLNPVERLQLDGSAYISRWLLKKYAKEMPFKRPFSESIVALALDAAVMLGARRHPRLITLDWEKLQKTLRQEMMDLLENAEDLDIPNPGYGIIFNPNLQRTIIDSPDGTFNGGDL